MRDTLVCIGYRGQMRLRSSLTELADHPSFRANVAWSLVHTENLLLPQRQLDAEHQHTVLKLSMAQRGTHMGHELGHTRHYFD